MFICIHINIGTQIPMHKFRNFQTEAPKVVTLFLTFTRENVALYVRCYRHSLNWDLPQILNFFPCFGFVIEIMDKTFI